MIEINEKNNNITDYDVSNYYIKRIERKHIYDQIMDMFKTLRPMFKYTPDNMQTMSVTIHPLFTLLLSSLYMAGVGGSVIYENACDEMFGSDFNEGPHAFLCHKHFRQLGPYKIEHYERCQKMVDEIHHFINRDRNKVIYAFLICCEHASFIFEDLETAMMQIGIQDVTYIKVHKNADNLYDGHGVRMLQALEKEPMPIEDFNRGMKLFSDLFSDIFNY
ncbi:hypothetical protein DICPUDRAFT_159875 [Dictyostelium purpureum]|uniref:Uncharacterized protein n=1 Tax=Dictyostelium purpureum TaxID=5786 RepID=F1A567_DICPU|nr:uncharacterized protein DICPUDRAFT_159875 [Dictyostelium purpureum]EGC28664.1 hypothetical protein DICPUDRAFT_159875 [Dictyostelium purpureum]|eukprot:XP_003294811.1 hypothetical protein DICPUDRAFT_159875 [Dictyostelium purpureum]